MDEETSSVSAVLDPETSAPVESPVVEQTTTQEVVTPPSEPEPLPEFSLKLDAAPEPELPSPPSFTPEDLDRHISSLSHEELAKRAPSYNKKIQQFQSKFRQEQQKAAQENYELSQWEQHFRSIPPQQLLAELQDPSYNQMYHKVREWVNSGGPAGGGVSRQAVAADMLNGMRSYFESKDDFRFVSDQWDEFTQETDLGSFITKVVEGANKKYRAGLEKAAKTQAQAYIQDVLAKRGITLPSPSTSSEAPQKGGTGLDYDTYIKMSPEQAAKLDPKDIDDMFARRRAQGK